MKTTNLQIFDRRIRSLVQAELLEDPDDGYIEAADTLWAVYKKRFLQELRAQGKAEPEHSHWSWKLKLEELWYEDAEFKCFAIACGGEPQGLMLLKHGRKYVSRLPEQQGQPLVYLAYLESAPWNLKEFCNAPIYGEVGSELYTAAVKFSRFLGLEERIGLHSLPGAEGFYEKKCHMISLGHDPECENLTYFESVGDSSKKGENE